MGAQDLPKCMLRNQEGNDKEKKGGGRGGGGIRGKEEFREKRDDGSHRISFREK